MSLSFPTTPALNQTHFTGGRVWTYNGSGWATSSEPSANLQSIPTSLVPSHNEMFDLGHSTVRWRDLYLSGNTIDLGGTEISSTANGVSFSNAISQSAVPVSVSSLQLGEGANAIVLSATSTGLQTVSGNTVVPIGGAVTVSNTTPTTTNLGSLWLDSETGKLRIYYGGSWAGIIGSGTGSAAGGVVLNLDGGRPDSNFGGITAFDAGGVV